ncbi:MAG: histidine kinase [Solirubrobacteraceae bacterium]|jgi:signal transduction histidine kinase
MTPRRVRCALAACGATLTAAATLVVAESGVSADRWQVLVAGVSVMLPFIGALELQRRYPERRLPALMAATGAAFFLRALNASPNPTVYTLARLFGPFSEVLLMALALSFPSGRLGSRRDRLILTVGILCIVCVRWPAIALSATLPTAGAFIFCTSRCPANVLLIGHSPQAASVLLAVYRALGFTLFLATAVRLAQRLRPATHLMRRVLTPVLVAAIARTITIMAGLALGFQSGTALMTASVLTVWGVPLAIVAGSLLNLSYDAGALERLVTGLRSRPDRRELREIMASALEDPTLELLYWIPDAGSYATGDGEIVDIEALAPGSGVTRVAREDGRPIAAILHDQALADHPKLVEAISASAALALEASRLEAEIAAGSAGTSKAVDAERTRIERDLHDGAQQRLIALRMKLSVLGHIIRRDVRQAQGVLDEMEGDLDAALQEIRSLAHGVAPPALVEGGIADALVAAARAAPVKVIVTTDGVGRYEPATESAVYFSCLEALQNVAKHAGTRATAHIAVRGEPDGVRFVVADDGCGFEREDVELRAGSGLANIQARLEELGGRLEIARGLSGGTIVTGSIPAA